MRLDRVGVFASSSLIHATRWAVVAERGVPADAGG
jgi:hypothetical protein